ncbi:MAG: iron ABC transporter permease [Rhodobiaceae bacterium]|nr:iron ABC transporter permease [Rhodobiaceae bacterium]
MTDSAHGPAAGIGLRKGRGASSLSILALVLALVLMSPIVTVAFAIFGGGGDTWAHLARTVLPRYIGNTVALAVIVTIGTFLLGTATAWVVTMCRFPGRKFFEWALVLPLAMPAYVIAYAYTEFLSHPGPVQTLLREVTGWGPRDYWFPNVRSLQGAAIMFILVLYPYVYLLARSAFLKQSVHAFDVGRTLGRTPFGAFVEVALPLARPAIATGVALALMETLADFGTVAHFGVQTFTTGIYRSWFNMGDRIAAAQLSSVLLAFVILIVSLERWNRGAARVDAADTHRAPPEFPLTGRKAAGAMLLCGLPFVLGFVLPVVLLLQLAISGGHLMPTARYVSNAVNSVIAAGVGAVVTVALAVVLAYAGRLAPSRLTGIATRLSSFGYAVPGSIIAVGLLIPLTRFDTVFSDWMYESFAIDTGQILTGTIVALIFAYAVRFMSVALNTVESSLAKITPNMDQAARTLGETGGGVLWRIHLPLMAGGLMTAALIVFVDIMKELPATIIMRPFNFDTLAVHAYQLAADERLSEAAVPSLTIVAVGIVPVILLSRQISKTRVSGA